ncbi:hypothetical protein J5690_01875 [bacterium]|nr:hypothetical protein [bacterium]
MIAVTAISCNKSEKERKQAAVFLSQREKKEVLENIAKLTEEIAKKEHEDLYAERGSQYIKLWRYFDALEDFKRAIYLDPINLRAIKKIAAIYFDFGDDENSLKYYNDMVQFLNLFKDSVKDSEMLKEMEKDAEFAKNRIGVLERIIAKREKDLTASYLRKQGNLRSDVENGKGVMLCPDGVRFEGMFENGMIKGEGKFIYPDGAELEGVFDGFVPVSIKKATCSGKETEYLLYRNNFGEWDLPFMNCPIR